MVATMAPGRITAEAQWWSRSGIDLTIEVLDTGPAARITSGDPGTGCGGTDRKSGDAATTSCGDTESGNQGAAAFPAAVGDPEIAIFLNIQTIG